MIHQLLQDLLKEQTKIDGEWKDDTDLRVTEIKAKEGRHICPVYQMIMERTRKQCMNPGSAFKLLKSKSKGVTFLALHW